MRQSALALRLKSFFTRSVASHDHWENRLKDIGGKLETLSASTENEFLDVGGQLQDFFRRARESSDVAASIADRIAGDEILQAEQGLSGILEHIGSLDNQARSGIHTMDAINRCLETTRSSLADFEKIVRNLNVLCSFIKIECAGSGSADAGFFNLTRDVKNLADLIEAKSGVLIDNTESLTALIKKSLRQALSFEKAQHDNARLILDRAINNLTALREKNSLSSVSLKDISTRWEKISASINEVVMSLQYHDITRQRIEHVKDAVCAMADGVKPKRNQNVLNIFDLNRYAASDANSSEKRESKSKAFARAVQTCRLQKNQLVHAGDELSAAIRRIAHNLEEISAHGQKMSSETAAMIGMEENREGSFLSDLEKELDLLSSSVREYNQLNDKLAAAMGQVAGTVGNMADFVGEIEKIGVGLRMIALNACIHAAQMGEDGAALGVLAESIHQLSVDTSCKLDSVAGGLKEIVSLADDLRANGNLNGQSGQQQGSDDLSGRIQKLIEPIHQMNADIVSLFTELDQSGKSLSEDIGRTVSGISIDAMVDDQIRWAAAQLDEISDEWGLRCDAEAQALAAEDLSDLAEKYTMQSERDVHDQVAGFIDFDSTPQASEAVEESCTTGVEDGETAENNNEFGDNVELF